MESFGKYWLVICLCIIGSCVSGQVNKDYNYRYRSPEGKTHILYVAGGSYHDYLAVASVLRRFLEIRHNYHVTYTEDYSVFTRSLNDYDVILMSGMPEELENDALDGFLNAVHKGKPVLGIHAATAAFSQDSIQQKKYDEVFGAHFDGHPPIYRFPVEIKEQSHAIVQNIAPFEIYDEMYFFKNVDDGSIVLMEAENEERGRTATAWTRKYGDGKVFYTSLGHGVGAATNRYFQQLILNALDWLMIDKQ